MATDDELKDLKELRGERDTIVQNVLASCTDEDGKLKTTGRNIVRQVLNDAILKYEVMIGERFEEQFDAIRFASRVPCASPSTLADFTLTNAIKGLRESGATTFDDLLKEMDKEIGNLAQRPLIRFDVHMVLNAIPEEGFSPLTLAVGDTNVQLRKTQDIDKVFSHAGVIAERDKIRQRVGFEHPIWDRLCLSVSLQARNDWYAVKAAQEIRDLLLALIELPIHERSMPLWNNGPTDAIDSLDSTLTFVLDETGTYHGACYGYETPLARRLRIDSKGLRDSLDRYSAAPADTQEIVKRAFSAFHHGVTEKNPAFAFIYFWSSLEQILLKDKDLKHFPMLQRLYRIVIAPNLIHQFELGQLLGLRNAIIHDAEYYRVGPYQRDLIKLYTESILHFFLFELADFTTDQIRLFYKEFNCHKNEFKRPRPPDEAAVFQRIESMRYPPTSGAPT